MVHPDVSRSIARYLAYADKLLPGRICSFYVVGSAALGAFRLGRSDIDFVAVVDGSLSESEIRRLRAVQFAVNIPVGLRVAARRQFAMPGTVNGVFVAQQDLAKPVTQIRPLASHSGISFSRNAGFDVNPVVWKVLQERGISVRGPAPSELGLDPEPNRLREWNRHNLRTYWRRWASAALFRRNFIASLRSSRDSLAWGALGSSRLHYTITTGDIVSKEAAGEYALDVFDSRWHPVIGDALAYWRGQPSRMLTDPGRRTRHTAEFVLEVIADAERL